MTPKTLDIPALRHATPDAFVLPPNIQTMLDRLDAHLVSLGDGRDCRSDNERANYSATVNTCRRLASGLRNAPQDLARTSSHLETVTALRQRWLDVQTEVEHEINTLRALSTTMDDQEFKRHIEPKYDLLQRRLQLLHDGTLLSGPGVTFGPLAWHDEQVAKWTTRRDQAQSTLDALVREAQELLKAAATTA